MDLSLHAVKIIPPLLYSTSLVGIQQDVLIDKSCEYFRWHGFNDKNFQENNGNCSLFGTNHQPKLTYCIKKGTLYQSYHNYEYNNYN